QFLFQAEDGIRSRNVTGVQTCARPISIAGRMEDLSGQGHPGTLTGTTDVAGKIGRARHFNAGNRITATPISVPTTDFTVAAWFQIGRASCRESGGIQGGE